jgi:sugar phosphate isomerase/epimerase
MMDKNKLAVSQVTTKNWDFAQDVKGYVSLGVEAMALWRDKLDLLGQGECLRLLAEVPLRVSSISDSGYFLSKTRSQTQRAIEDVVEAIDLAQAVGAYSVVLITGEDGSVFRTPDQDRQIVVDAMREVASVAEGHGVKLAIEAVNGERYPGLTFLHTIPDVIALLDDIGSPAVGLCFDFDHLWEEDDLIAHIAALKGRIFAVHLCDMPVAPRPPFDRRLPGEGVAPLRDILGAIQDSGYDGYYDLEIFSLDLWDEDYPTLIHRSQEAFAAL